MQRLIKSVVLGMLMIMASSVYAMSAPDSSGWMYYGETKYENGETVRIYVHQNIVNSNNDKNVRAYWTCYQTEKYDTYMLNMMFMDAKTYTWLKCINRLPNGTIANTITNDKYKEEVTPIRANTLEQQMWHMIAGTGKQF